MPQLTARRSATTALVAITAAFAVCAVEFLFHVSGGLRNFLNDWIYDNVVFAAGAAVLARGVAVKRDVLRRPRLHDVGKMAIPDEILEKPGPLTEQFDPLVVSVFADVIADRGAPRVALAS